jgi:hypothetical protein
VARPKKNPPTSGSAGFDFSFGCPGWTPYSAAPAPVIHDRMPMPMVMDMVVIEITVQQAVPNMST